MVELTPIESIVIKAMQELGCTSESSLKTADDIAKRSNRPKSLVTNTLVTLVQKGMAKRIAREKASGYYLIKATAE